jgi:hypothetical protein
MTIRTTKPAINLREELASLRNQGGYSEQQFYFDGLVTNGTFDNDTTSWSLTNPSGSTVESSSGRLRIVTDGVGAGASQILFTIGKRYLISFNYEAVSGSLKLDSIISTLSATQIYSTIWTATQTNLTFYRFSGAAEGYIDNVKVFEVDANDDVSHTMPKGWKPKDVFEDGLLQREGSAHDYEVVYDGFDYKVKPTVAPTATTETCVIGVKA